MATLIERYDLQYGHTLLRQRVQVAIESAAYDVINEDPATANHANRIIWANTALNNPERLTAIEMSLVVQNPAIAAAGDNATDGDIQFVVNGLVDPIANGIANGVIKVQ
jgi:hypothetical protein